MITDVADGEISDSSSDAVNGSQLHGVSSYVVDALGGGAEVNADGTITAPTYTIANADYDNVGDALNAIDTTLDERFCPGMRTPVKMVHLAPLTEKIKLPV